MKLSRATSTAAISAAVLTLLLAGCSASVVEPESKPDQAAVTTESASPGDSTSAEDSSKPADETAQQPQAPSAGTMSDANTVARDVWIKTATQEQRCDGDLTLSNPGEIVHVTGACGTLTLSLDGGVVIADDVETLIVSGTGTTVYTGTVSELKVTGDGIVVLWDGENPAVSDSGIGNVLMHG